MCIILSESARQQFKPSKNQRKYKCPYCDYRNIKSELIDHINDNHEDLIPKGYTAARVVFNMINKKEHGSCIICRKETQWDENKCRYNRLCERKECHDEYVKYAHRNTNIEEKLRDPEFQQKMLAGRGISGEYKFTGGYKVSYCGSYEKKLLEFMDKFLHVRPEDIQSPGPVIEYEYNGDTSPNVDQERAIFERKLMRSILSSYIKASEIERHKRAAKFELQSTPKEQ